MPKFPKVRRDLAVLIDEKVSFSELKGLALKASKDVLREVKIFDVYRGENIDKGKKSYALSFVFQDLNKTLTDSFVDEQMRCIYNSFNEHLSAELRDGEL